MIWFVAEGGWDDAAARAHDAPALLLTVLMLGDGARSDSGETGMQVIDLAVRRS